MQTPPLPPQAQASCGLATCSLVFGICGVVLGPLTGIPAIVTGHLALSRIKSSGGALEGRGKAVAGLIMGYVFSLLLCVIAIVAAAGFAAANAAIQKSRSMATLATATAIERAVDGFFTEYGTMPLAGTADITVLTDKDTDLLHVLLGMESVMNLRSIRFLAVKEGRNGKNGIVHTPDGLRVSGLYDAWGGGYHVRLDLDGDSRLDADGAAVTGRRVVVWSAGPDRISGTRDDVRTW
jgi:hypothetical protein